MKEVHLTRKSFCFLFFSPHFGTQSRRSPSFPLYSMAIKYFDHSDSMIRIAVRTVTLNVFKVCTSRLDSFLVDGDHSVYFTDVSRYLLKQIRILQERLAILCAGAQGWEVKFGGLSPSTGLYEKFVSCVPFASPKTTLRRLGSFQTWIHDSWQDITDLLYYVDDVLTVGPPMVVQCLRKAIWEMLQSIASDSMRTAYTIETFAQRCGADENILYEISEVSTRIPYADRFAECGYEYCHILSETSTRDYEEGEELSRSASVTNASPMHLLLGRPCLRNVTSAEQIFPWCMYPSSILFSSLNEPGKKEQNAYNPENTHLDASVVIMILTQTLRIVKDTTLATTLAEKFLFDSYNMDSNDRLFPKCHRQAFETLFGADYISNMDGLDKSRNQPMLQCFINSYDNRLKQCTSDLLWTVVSLAKDTPRLSQVHWVTMKTYFPDINDLYGMSKESSLGIHGSIRYSLLHKAALGYQIPANSDLMFEALVSPKTNKSHSFSFSPRTEKLKSSKVSEERSRVKSCDNSAIDLPCERDDSEFGEADMVEDGLSSVLQEEQVARETLLSSLVSNICADSSQLQDLIQCFCGEDKLTSLVAWDRYTHDIVPSDIFRSGIFTIYLILLPLAAETFGWKLHRRSSTSDSRKEVQTQQHIFSQPVFPLQAANKMKENVQSTSVFLKQCVDHSQEKDIGGLVNVVNAFDAVSYIFSLTKFPSQQRSNDVTITCENAARKSTNFIGAGHVAERLHSEAACAITEAAELTSEIGGGRENMQEHGDNNRQVHQSTDSLLLSAFSPEFDELQPKSGENTNNVSQNLNGNHCSPELTDAQMGEAAAEITAVAVLRQAASNAVPPFGQQEGVEPLNKIHLFWLCVERLYLIRTLFLKLSGLQHLSAPGSSAGSQSNDILRIWGEDEKLIQTPAHAWKCTSAIGEEVHKDSMFFVCSIRPQHGSGYPPSTATTQHAVALKPECMDIAAPSGNVYEVKCSIPFQYVAKSTRQNLSIHLKLLIWDFYQMPSYLFTENNGERRDIDRKILPATQCRYETVLKFENEDIAESVNQWIQSRKEENILNQKNEIMKLVDGHLYSTIISGLTNVQAESGEIYYTDMEHGAY